MRILTALDGKWTWMRKDVTGRLERKHHTLEIADSFHKLYVALDEGQYELVIAQFSLVDQDNLFSIRKAKSRSSTLRFWVESNKALSKSVIRNLTSLGVDKVMLRKDVVRELEEAGVITPAEEVPQTASK